MDIPVTEKTRMKKYLIGQQPTYIQRLSETLGGYEVRVTRRDGKNLGVRKDKNSNRINVEETKGRISKVLWKG